MAKRSATELFEHYYTVLVYSLPLKDADFIEELVKHDLLPRDLKSSLESLTINSERASYFLDNVIKPGLSVGNSQCFVKLLTVMNSSKYYNVKDLARTIEKELAIDTKCKIINYLFVRCVKNFYMCRFIKATLEGFTEHCGT